MIIPHMQFTNKNAVAQDIILHDALLRGKCSLDQFSAGLEEVGILRWAKLFPVAFEGLFTYHSPEELTAGSVIQLLRFPKEVQPEHYMLRRYVQGLLNEGVLS